MSTSHFIEYLDRSIVISPDFIKKQLPGYKPQKASAFNTKSNKVANKIFKEVIQKSEIKQIILLNGGSASGKTEFIKTRLNTQAAIIYDYTMRSAEGARIKIKLALKSKKVIAIIAVIPDDLERAYNAFLGRERKFDDIHFFETHSNSRKTLLEIMDTYPEIQISIIISKYSNKNLLQFKELTFETTSDLEYYIRSIQISIDDIIQTITN